ncbi:LytR/AlgR family response regulator transcription factor [Flavivirga jejuensis]|uniref:Response regulator transcription factor n=1 Tax=Flavivirga jejuensis TaxID=870487 RepID=A0ABT8WPR6_9FLAO|nr:response regulator transcription factor [Flavivirga jejuensis]MDO5974907.1 response regulator transcription factor [Flavivirga jejuensis]
MHIINVLVLEDDDFEAVILKEYLEENHFNIVKICNNIVDAIEIYHTQTIDFIIIDIFLNGKPDGITFAKTLLKRTRNVTPFLFLTGHAERSIFENAKVTHPHGFVLKPFNEKELVYTIQLILNKHNRSIEDNTALNDNSSVPYFFKKNGVFYKILPKDISFVEVEGRYCKIITLKTNFISQYTLTDFHKQLPSFFLRVHRNYVVNANKIKEVHSKDNLIVLENNQTITLGRAYKNTFFDHYKVIR